ncbi:lipopolysaccharide biosynthesis protein [Pedobacter heparinus]|uniref:Polysaccharide biosynthesis protein n=1 Tax=Pedobacter heparinus (strain ATCC 13125 / DSM 2366 / CIP 104194 / JCM 7457 / NBRC 12017 / NCIMB 9290 / NRRL B-14731 / HIM 762-3) TaxID=485917 RepID=C6XVP7_PEDHD|nr:polysaccharide biosynthesis protein [Pedobacter heparinus]ACU06122.1 polysaccharide biosynthesis protein [Pedobacter heparinus DSM 2366]
MSSFIKIYLWQILSLISGFATMVIVTPFLSSNPYLFGIYSVVMSMSLFLAYADLGFLSAGAKYASEYAVRNERKQEIEIISFVTFILGGFVLLISIVALVFSFLPHLLIKSLPDLNSKNVASTLLLVFALSTPLLVLQRSVQIIFNIRLKDYLYQRIFTASNIIKILSSFFFFGRGKYLLVEYFIFSQFVGLIAVILALLLAKKSFNYNLKMYFASIKFSKEIFNKTKKLAFSSLFVTIAWIVFYEIDLFVIGKFIGAKGVAIFSLSITLMALFRSLHSIIYNPFTAKFNHYIGKRDFSGFNRAFYKVLVLGLPLSVFPTLIVAFTIKSFIYSWVGIEYEEVIPIVRIMLFIYLFNFIASPASIALVAHERIRSIYLTTAIMPLIYWGGIIVTYNFWGLQSFAIFKLFAFSLSSMVYSYLSIKLFGVDFKQFLSRNVLQATIVSIALYFIVYYTQTYLPYFKKPGNLFKYTMLCSGYLVFSLVLYYLLSSQFRKTILEFLPSFSKLFKFKRESI